MPPRRVRLFFSGGADSPAERMAAIRQLRKGQILNHLLKNGPTSRVDIARALGFNLRTVSLLVASLVEDNVVVEQPVKVSTSMGRRPVPLELNAEAACVLAIDVRRFRTDWALLDLQGRLLVKDSTPSDFGDSPEEQATWLVEMTTRFLAAHHGMLPPLAGAGLSFEGFVFKQHVAHRHGAVTEVIRETLEKALDSPVIADTDSRLVALGEQWFGAAGGAGNAVLVNISDGLGLGCIVNGKLLAGHNGLAGEIGHVPLGDPGIACYCGASGCLENIVSGSGLVRLATQSAIFSDTRKPDLQVLMDSVSHNPRARAVVDKFIRHLSMAVVLTTNIFDPETIVLGGPVAPLIAPFHHQILDTLDSSAVPFILEKTRISFSTLGEDAVLLGAAAQILSHIYSASHVDAEALL